MDKFWKAALGVAGIGAIGFFVFWSLYQGWLDLPIFPMLSQDQAFQLLKLFLYLTFGALVLGVLAYISTHRTAGQINNYEPIRSTNLTLPNGSKFSDEQFETYRKVWILLQNLRSAGNDLWRRASKNNLAHFAACLRETKDIVNNGSIFFHQEDYSQLKSILETFANYSSGKERLIDLRNSTEIDLSEIRAQIKENGGHLRTYSDLLETMRAKYHDRLDWKKAS